MKKDSTNESEILSALKSQSKDIKKILRIIEPAERNLTVNQAAASCLISKEFTKKIRPSSLETCKKSFRSLCDSVGALAIRSITPKIIETQWLAKHPNWSPKTHNNNLKYARSLFEWLVKNRYLNRNPAGDVDFAIVPFKQPVILTVDDLERLLHACQKHDVAFLGWMCPVIFQGLRAAESRRMLPKNVGIETIDLNAGEQVKTNRRRAFELSEVFKRWMAVPGVEIRPMSEKEQEKRFGKIKELAGVKVPKNSLRHSCASYWVKLKGTTAAAKILGNSEPILTANYMNTTISLEDAKRFEALRPLPAFVGDSDHEKDDRVL